VLVSGAFIEFRIDDAEIKQLIEGLSYRLKSMRPAMNLVGEIVVESVQRNFEQRRSPKGDQWKPVSPDYAAWKGRKGYDPGNILILHNILMKSIHRKATETEVRVGTNIVYAAIHQFGGPIKKATRPTRSTMRNAREHFAARVLSRPTIMPARPYLGVRDDDWPKIRAAILNYLIAKSGVPRASNR
jgi:phage virion morphogenesis protein